MQLGRISLPTHNDSEDFDEYEDGDYPQNNEHQNKFKYSKNINLRKSSQKSRNSNDMLSVGDFNAMHFDTLPFDQASAGEDIDYYELLDNPEINFRFMLYGQNGNGKSTFAVKFAKFLSEKFGKTLFCSSEEGISISLQNKVKHIKNKNFFVVACKTGKELITLLKRRENFDIDFIFIDSINDMNITLEEFTQIIELKPRGVVYIMQCNKDGSFRGKNAFAHDCDIRVRVENFEPHTEKNRYR